MTKKETGRLIYWLLRVIRQGPQRGAIAYLTELGYDPSSERAYNIVQLGEP